MSVAVAQLAVLDCGPTAGHPQVNLARVQVIGHVAQLERRDAVVRVDVFDVDDQVSVLLAGHGFLLDQRNAVLAEQMQVIQ